MPRIGQPKLWVATPAFGLALVDGFEAGCWATGFWTACPGAAGLGVAVGAGFAAGFALAAGAAGTAGAAGLETPWLDCLAGAATAGAAAFLAAAGAFWATGALVEVGAGAAGLGVATGAFWDRTTGAWVGGSGVGVGGGGGGGQVPPGTIILAPVCNGTLAETLLGLKLIMF